MVVVKDPPNVVWLKQPIISSKVINVGPAARNPGCGVGVGSDTIFPVHPGGYLVANTHTTNHSSDGPESYNEIYHVDRPNQVSVTVAQGTGACELTKHARAQLQAIETYPSTLE